MIGRGTLALSVAAGLGLGLMLSAHSSRTGAEEATDSEPAQAPSQLFLRAFDAPVRGLDFEGAPPAALPGPCAMAHPRRFRAPAPPAPPPCSSLPEVRVELLATPPPPA